MAEPQAMKAKHERCVEGIGKPHCHDCMPASWPCDASTARSALERIESKAEGWRVGAAPGIEAAYTDAVRVIREMRDIARRETRVGQP